MKKPFPGMNPWLEEYWRDVHASLLVSARNTLNGELPPGLRARVDERLAIESEEDGKPHGYLPDVAITESWDQPASQFVASATAAAVLAEPIIVDLGDATVRHLEIVDSREHVITAIEVLSPPNKGDAIQRHRWEVKRRDYLCGGINLVEIDLLRGGEWTLAAPDSLKPPPPERVVYHACVTRAPLPNRHEFYLLPLRERLPAIRIPLRHGEADMALDLQALVDDCYAHGRYVDVFDYSKPPHPSLPAEEAAWARELLAAPRG